MLTIVGGIIHTTFYYPLKHMYRDNCIRWILLKYFPLQLASEAPGEVGSPFYTTSVTVMQFLF